MNRHPFHRDDPPRTPPARSPCSPRRRPRRLADDVLVEVGLVDRMAPVASPLGTLWIAWNGRGDLRGGAGGRRRRGDRPPRGPTGRRTIAGGRASRRGSPTPSRGGSPGSGGSASRWTSAAASEFEVAVWTKALEIPAGEVRPYGWIAAEIGRPKAVRAVGTALGHNPVPLIVPCHRVVRTDGTIGQYSLGGPRNKRTILAAEGLDPDGDGGRRAARRAALRLDDDAHRVLADLPPRAPRPGPLPGLVPVAAGGAGEGLSAVQDLPPDRGRGGRLTPGVTDSQLGLIH